MRAGAYRPLAGEAGKARASRPGVGVRPIRDYRSLTRAGVCGHDGLRRAPCQRSVMNSGDQEAHAMTSADRFVLRVYRGLADTHPGGYDVAGRLFDHPLNWGRLTPTRLNDLSV